MSVVCFFCWCLVLFVGSVAPRHILVSFLPCLAPFFSVVQFFCTSPSSLSPLDSFLAPSLVFSFWLAVARLLGVLCFGLLFFVFLLSWLCWFGLSCLAPADVLVPPVDSVLVPCSFTFLAMDFVVLVVSGELRVVAPVGWSLGEVLVQGGPGEEISFCSLVRPGLAPITLSFVGDSWVGFGSVAPAGWFSPAGELLDSGLGDFFDDSFGGGSAGIHFTF